MERSVNMVYLNLNLNLRHHCPYPKSILIYIPTPNLHPYCFPCCSGSGAWALMPRGASSCVTVVTSVRFIVGSSVRRCAAAMTVHPADPPSAILPHRLPYDVGEHLVVLLQRSTPTSKKTFKLVTIVYLFVLSDESEVNHHHD